MIHDAARGASNLPIDSVVRSRHYDGDAPAWWTSGPGGAGSTRILFPGGILRTYPTGIGVVFELSSRPDDNNGDGQPDFTFKRERGQLALIRIPGV